MTAAIAALQVADALKILARGTDSVIARLTTIDVWTGTIRQTRAALLVMRDARAASAGNWSIWMAPGARPSACAGATRCRFMNARAPWISLTLAATPGYGRDGTLQ